MTLLKDELKLYIVRTGLSMRKLADLLTQKTGKPVTVQNLSNKFSKETIRYKEILEIADVLGYEIKWVEKS